MIDGILLSLCLAGAVFSRVLYYNAGRRLDDERLLGATVLDVTSSLFALLVLMVYWNIIPQ